MEASPLQHERLLRDRVALGCVPLNVMLAAERGVVERFVDIDDVRDAKVGNLLGARFAQPARLFTPHDARQVQLDALELTKSGKWWREYTAESTCVLNLNDAAPFPALTLVE